ncbi:class I SAM-dependent DNA methyltransferase [Rickettsiales endosymbiont of Stachyamoeba lipophora]|uniref:class I SAM-dependent DNA methyltransferase n=1 Tax=Rickettsiales endosymbiont of Stachyamoeba lipophora TaxID=2486578 RepID=UPI0024078DB5|nr:class I SAM-dependent methyltransferase [Rickettsiales endosymbiont of Stachyamoeba lipophora]
MVDWFDEHRSRDLFEKAWLDKAIALLSKNPHILDLGCGMGDPIIPYFLEKGCAVTGVDGSAKLIALAKSRHLEVKFIISDMRGLNLAQKFDLVIAWHSFFHLSQDEQRAMFKTFTSHLKSGGALLFTSGTEAGEEWSNNGGENLYHASLSPVEYKEILKQHGFTVIDYKISDPECGYATFWLAKLEK